MATSSGPWPDPGTRAADWLVGRRRLVGAIWLGAFAGHGWGRDPTPGGFDEPAAAARRLAAGACVLMWRHAATESGVGDPPQFDLARCDTQRNLSDAGRAQAQRFGQWLLERGLRPTAVRSSAWCRCRDSAELAFGRHVVWAPLNSMFGDRVRSADPLPALRAALAALPAPGFEVWVTHQVNISALTGAHTAMGEAVVVNRQGTIEARLLVP